jgi:hypothetical protein
MGGKPVNAVQFFTYLTQHDSTRALAAQLVGVYTHRIDIEREPSTRVPCSVAR